MLPLSIADADWPYFVADDLISDLASHKSRAALLKKVKVKKELTGKHGHSSFVIDAMNYTPDKSVCQ